ncbi:unnamed protein product [Onchocerca flexuosa]|uniref:Uncharacterized protein n=1 Tax=Onchocerca flexuosa TaxID=387005 RepID=A0A183HQY7_9BILA|nr:unnamed protein product [Onchocerca flexuosa]
MTQIIRNELSDYNCVEHESESSLSAKRRNDDDDDDRINKETMETDLVTNCATQSIAKQDFADKSRLDGESVITAIAQEKLMKSEESANYKNERNMANHPQETQNANDLKFVERTVENKKSVNHRTEEIVEQLQDLRRKEVKNSEDTVMESISKHKEKNGRLSLLNQSTDSYHDLTKVQNGITLGSTSLNSNHREGYGQESSKSTNHSIQRLEG